MTVDETPWPSVTIAIPTLNGIGWLGSSLADFLNQDYRGKFDILLLDSGSTDGTAQLGQSEGRIKIHSIEPDDFGHGKTRNLANALVDSELILFTVQDARPYNAQWITNMVKALLDHQLDAVCGGQAAPHNADINPLEWYRPLLEESNKIDKVIGTAFQTWPPEKQLERCGWDNVNALYRRTALAHHPFEDVRFGEDLRWAKGWLEQGGNIGYAYHCKVWHHHHHQGDYTRRRVLNTLYWRWKTFGVLPPLPQRPTLSVGLKMLKRLVWNNHIHHPATLWSWWKYNWKKAENAAAAGSEFASALSQSTEDVDRLYESLGKTSPIAKKKP